MQKWEWKLREEMPLLLWRSNTCVYTASSWRKHLFVFLTKLWKLSCMCFWLAFHCARMDQGEECLGKVGKAQRGSKGSLTPFHRVSQSLATKKPCLWAPTGSLQGFYRMFQEFLQEVQKFYRKFRSSTGCFTIGFLDDGQVGENAWMGREVR